MCKINNCTIASSQTLLALNNKNLTAYNNAFLYTQPKIYYYIAKSIKEYNYITPWLVKDLKNPILRIYIYGSYSTFLFLTSFFFTRVSSIALELPAYILTRQNLE